MGNRGSAPAAAAGGGADDARAVHKVQLAASVLGGAGPLTAYHTSVLIDGEEFFFDGAGISSTRDLGSHAEMQKQSGNAPQISDLGMSKFSASQMLSALRPHFQGGSYDLLRKNCNSFSDCAVFYLLRQRIDARYRKIEQTGASHLSLVQSMSGGKYDPNPAAEGFDVDKVIAAVDPEKHWSTPGQVLGGGGAGEAVAASPEEMRRKRLAALEARTSA